MSRYDVIVIGGGSPLPRVGRSAPDSQAVAPAVRGSSLASW